MTETVNIRFKLNKKRHTKLRAFMKRNGIKNYNEFFEVATFNMIWESERND